MFTPDAQAALYAFAGTIVGLIASWIVARIRRASNQDTVDATSLQAAAAEWRQMNDSRKAELAQLRSELADLREEFNATTTDHEIAMAKLRKQYDDERERDASWRSTAVNYVESLREHIFRELPPPPPATPAGWSNKEE